MRLRMGGIGGKALRWTAGLLFLAVVVVGIWLGPTLKDLFKAGFLKKAPAKHGYAGSTVDNLKALYTGMSLSNESDGQFPAAATWMDEVDKRIATNDLKKGEAEKKFIDPAAGPGPGQFGFAMNDAAGGKFYDEARKVKDDFPDPKTTILLFESTDLSRNAHGDPAKIGRKGGVAIAVDGSIIKMP